MMKTIHLVPALALGLLLSTATSAQETAAETAAPTGSAPQSGTQDPIASTENGTARLDAATAQMIERLTAAEAELVELRERISIEREPLARRVGELEAELSEARAEYQIVLRQKDARGSDLSRLETDVEARRKEIKFLSGQLDQYAGDFDSRLLLHEKQRFGGIVEQARQASTDASLNSGEVFAAQTAMIEASLERLEGALGGERFTGQATDEQGFLREGQFLTIGPTAYFASTDFETVGRVREVAGTKTPSVLPFLEPAQNEAAAQTLRNKSGVLPIDPTLGSAARVEATEQTWLEHIEAGGPVVIPIFAMAAIALLIAIAKWFQLQFVPRPSKRQVREFLDRVRDGDNEGAERSARAMPGPTGSMLLAGSQSLGYPKELIEEVMYESMVGARRKLNSMLPFIGVAAAAAPLMGLLGTVTGIIDTFRLITEFGSGDAKSLSGGISEALITTKFGLVVAIPSLLVHAYLTRKARGIVSDMEASAMALVNRVSTIDSKSPRPASGRELLDGGPKPDPEAVREQVEELVREMLAPLTASGAGRADHDS